MSIQSLLKPFIVRGRAMQRWYQVAGSVIDRFGAIPDTQASSSFLKGLFSRLVTIILHTARGFEVDFDRLPSALFAFNNDFMGTEEKVKKRKRGQWTEARSASFAASARILNELSALKQVAALDLSSLVSMSTDLRYAQSEEVLFEGVGKVWCPGLTPRSLCFAGRVRSTQLSSQVQSLSKH